MPGSFTELDSKRSVYDVPLSPSYISSRSADVILSDVRPTKLDDDALNSINAFLDELLHTILSAARALTTTQLRAGLNKVLPTTLGKEAVLEAELELRAYWERTGGVPGSGSSHLVSEDSSFNLQWTFEVPVHSVSSLSLLGVSRSLNIHLFQLLRLKCEAYSTLSDTDENSDAETRLFQRMNAEGVAPPKQTLLAPASLYLTAIIEHIVSNVGRVAARDSSRAIANGQDLFIALCEDSSIYGLFKNMAVYAQIEVLSRTPRSRQSMSISVALESDGTPFVVGSASLRNGSIHQPRTRLSSESVGNPPPSTANSSRPSVDKSRAVKRLYNKVSQDFIGGSEPGHRKVDSFASANTKQSLASKGDRSPISPTFSEDTRSQEFDDMMRSGSTMKVSLTPDRLRTMEVLNKEKARMSGRQKTPLKTEKSNGFDAPPSHSSPEPVKRTPTIRRVGSNLDIEEDRLTQKPPPTSRPRQLSAATASGYTISSLSRVRASSTTDPSAALSTTLLNKHMLSESNSALADHRSVSGSTPKRRAPPQELDLNGSRPLRTRSIARSRDSVDVEESVAGSDDDGMGELTPFASPKHRDRQRGFSSSTRELIAFLAEGPPEPTPSENSLSPLSPTTKKSGRLQKMISRITLASETVKPPRKMTVGSGDASSRSMTNLSALANRPVPPRYPTSTQSPAVSSESGFTDQAGAQPRQRAQSYAQKPLSTWDGKSIEGETSSPSATSRSHEIDDVTLKTTPITPIVLQKPVEVDVSQHVKPAKPPPSPTLLTPPVPSVTIPVRVEAADATPAPAVQSTLSPPPPIVPQRVSSKTSSLLCQKITPHPAAETLPPAPSVIEHARELRTMLDHATSVAECRILVDMFLARSRLAPDLRTSVTLPPPRDVGDSANGLERTVVEMFLGGGEDVEDKPPFDTSSAEPAESQLRAADTACPPLSIIKLTEPSEPR
ncbi:hypothetical protein JVU11DRAFT_1517 [Chiua virens]|nr:hypothetical protein JVU11DRAFT_1517 [Chiua virens]